MTNEELTNKLYSMKVLIVPHGRGDSKTLRHVVDDIFNLGWNSAIDTMIQEITNGNNSKNN